MCKVCDAEGVLLDEVERVTLENRSDGHNKQYTLFLRKERDGWVVMARWGPIGKWEKSKSKSPPFPSQSGARAILHDLHDKKIKRGYVRRICTEAEA